MDDGRVAADTVRRVPARWVGARVAGRAEDDAERSANIVSRSGARYEGVPSPADAESDVAIISRSR